MEGTRTRVQLAALKRRPVRLGPADKERRRALALSFLENPIHDIYVRRSDMTIIDGHERVEGLVLLGKTEAEVVLVDGDLTDDHLDDIAFETAFHRSPLGGYEQAILLRRKKEHNPKVTGKDLAAQLKFDPGMVTKLMSLFDCPADVQEDARLGKIGVAKWYEISRKPKPDAAEDATPPATDDDTPAKSVKIALPGDASIVVKGKGLTLAEVARLLLATHKDATAALKDNLDSKTFSRVMADRAAKPLKGAPADATA